MGCHRGLASFVCQNLLDRWSIEPRNKKCKIRVVITSLKQILKQPFSIFWFRVDVVWAISGVYTAFYAVISSAERSLHKVLFQIRLNVVLIDIYEVISVRPQQC